MIMSPVIDPAQAEISPRGSPYRPRLAPGCTVARLKPVPEPAPCEVPDLRVSIADSLKAMPWLGPSDEAIKALAVNVAEQIETAKDRAAELDALWREPGAADIVKRLQALEARCDVTKMVGWLGPQLQGYLKDLAGNPVARKAMQQDKPIGGRLAQIRRDAGEDD